MSPPMEEHQLLEGLSIAHLKFLRVWHGINTYLVTGRRSRGINILTIHCVLFALPYVLFQVLSFFYIPINLKQLTFLYLNGLPCIQVIIKAIVFWVRFDEQCDVFNLLKQDFLHCIPQHKMPHAREIYKKSAKITNVSCLMAFYGTSSCVVSWILAPGIKAEDMTGAKCTKVMGGWYPFPFSHSPWFYIVFTYETALLVSHGLLISFFECVIIQPLLCLWAHFRVLGYHIRTLKVTDAVHSGNKDSVEYLNGELRAIMSDYNVLLRYATTLQEVLNLLVTVILGTGIIILMMGILELKFEEKDFMFTFHFFTFMSYEAIEVFLICVSSSALETASADIRFSLYSSDWYLADKRFAMTAQMMMIRATKPLTLIAVKMYPVNLEIVLGIFQFTYTAAMVLSNTKE